MDGWMDGCSSSSSSRRRRKSDNDNDDDDGGGGGNKMRDGSKLLPALLTVECSLYWTLAWRSSEENASQFRALALYSCYDAPSPLTDVRSPCQFNCGPFLSTITHPSWCPLFSPISSD